MSFSFRKDILPLPKDFAFDFFTTGGIPSDQPVLHFHDCLELNYVVEGSGTNYIENKRYPLVPGDFYVINNLEHHIAIPDGSMKLKVIIFDPVFIWQNNPFDYEYLLPFFNRSVHFSNCIKKDNPLSQKLLDILMEIEYEWTVRQEGYRLVIKAALMKLLAILYRHFKQNSEIGEDIKAFHKSYDRLRGVIEYINDNLCKELTLKELADIAFMNRTYFSGFFKEVMKMNVSDYVEMLRVNHACRLLRTTNLSITEIGFSCGFNSLSYFNRTFKKHNHISPKEYRG